MSVAQVVAVIAAMKAVVQSVAPTRVVSETFKAFDLRADADLQAGVITILFSGVDAYDYEHSDSFDGIDATQTDNALIALQVLGQQRIDADATDTEAQAAELALLADIEKLANVGIQNDVLANLRITSAKTSTQLEAPYVWVHTTFNCRHDGA